MAMNPFVNSKRFLISIATKEAHLDRINNVKDGIVVLHVLSNTDLSMLHEFKAIYRKFDKIVSSCFNQLPVNIHYIHHLFSQKIVNMSSASTEEHLKNISDVKYRIHVQPIFSIADSSTPRKVESTYGKHGTNV